MRSKGKGESERRITVIAQWSGVLIGTELSWPRVYTNDLMKTSNSFTNTMHDCPYEYLLLTMSQAQTS